jgi:3-oxoacyl-[acyl-carrier-protein] synthase-3
MRYARLVSTGMYLPPVEVANDVFRERLKDSAPDFVDKMVVNSSIRKRWYARDDQVTSDLAVAAARQALANAGRTAEEVDLVILGTDSPDYVTPATSVVMQHKLGAMNAGTFDIGCACASFPTAFSTAAGLIATNPHLETVVVAGAYLMHRLADPADPMTFFYGDGAGAAVLEAGDEPGFITSAFEAHGQYAGYWGIFSGGTVEPASESSLREGRTRVRMLQRYPPEANNEGWPRLVRTLAANGNFEVEDIDFIIFTQVRKSSIEIVMQTLQLPMERTHTVMEEWGYTGSACIPMALHDARERGRITPGDLVVLVGSGVGHNLAAVAFRA